MNCFVWMFRIKLMKAIGNLMVGACNNGASNDKREEESYCRGGLCNMRELISML